MQCWICKSTKLALVRRGVQVCEGGSEGFRITDKNYGQTADLYDCEECGFRQAGTITDVLTQYETMSDHAYEDTRGPRAIQARRLIRMIQRYKVSGKLLDVGAASGILVEEAQLAGYLSEGVEPSRPLQAIAVERGLPVHCGTLSSTAVRGPYDVACVVDVIEHVPDPVGLMSNVREVLAPDGICLVVTPDVHSVAARLMGFSWWHYRVAHIGYFNRSTLERTLHSAGFQIIDWSRPIWYFPMDYLLERFMQYLHLRFKPPAISRRFVVPLNLFDSLLVICAPRRRNSN